jgi:hypothetical protein
VDVVASLPRVSAGRRSLFAAVPVYWHLLSLDAPTVAVLWAWSFARVAHVRPDVNSLAVLAIGTWLLYIADRLLDGRPGADPADLRERHHFHTRHGRELLIAGAAACAPLVWFVIRMPAAARRDDTILFALAMLYFAAVHAAEVRFRFPREVAVGILFACACAVPAWSEAVSSHAQLEWLVPLFAALCWLNCRAIHVWEQAEIAADGWLVPAVALSLAVAAAASMLITSSPLRLRLATAIMASALLLFALDRDRRRGRKRAARDGNLSVLALRILADAALLTPLLVLIRWRL